MGHELGRPVILDRQPGVARLEIVALEIQTEGPPDPLENSGSDRLVHRDPDLCVADLAEVDPLASPGLHDNALKRTDLDRHRIEKQLGLDRVAAGLQPHHQTLGLAMNALCDGLQPLGPVEHGIERRHDREECLRRADVRRRLLAPDMLFAGLQGQAVGLVAPRIDRHPDEAPGHRPLVGIAAGHIGRVRATIAHRHTKPLGGPDGDVGPHRARFLEQSQREGIGDDDAQSLRLVQRRDLTGEITDMAIGPRILEHGGKDLVRIQRVRLPDDDLDAERRTAGLDHRDVLRVAVGVDENRRRFRFRDTLRHRHGLGCRRCLVEKRGIGDFKPGKIRDHRLIIQEGFQPALTDFRLVGGISRIPCGVFKDVPLDGRRRHRAVIALPDHRREDRVLLRDLAHTPEKFTF